MSDVMREVDERSKLAGTNKFELLIFRLGEDRNSIVVTTPAPAHSAMPTINEIEK